MKTVSINKTIPLRYETDVFVAGGGPAGVAAALAAAQNGAKVFIAESQACFGGMGTVGLVPVFMKLTDGVNSLTGGIGKKIIDNLQQAGGYVPDQGITLRAEVYKRVLDKMITDAGIDFTFNTTLIGTESENGTVSHVILSSKNGLFALKAKMYIDCTGDGDLAAWAGAPYEKGDEENTMMAATVTSLWAGIDWQKVVKPDNRKLEDAFDHGVFEVEDKHLPGMWKTGVHLGGGNIGHSFDVDGTDDRSITKGLVYGRRLITQYERYYKEFLDGFKDMELVSTCSILGVRETRRIIGDYILDLDDFNNRASFEDEIGRYAWPVDIHAGKGDNESFKKYLTDFRKYRYGTGESYGVPYRILTPKDLTNVFVAGRCVSTDRAMQSSIRCMAGCFLTGQAAGVAAAMASIQNKDNRSINVTELQDKLLDMGTYFKRK